jgi:hypothetical protein
MIGHKLPNKNEKCYSSRTQTFSPTKQPLSACQSSYNLLFLTSVVVVASVVKGETVYC